MPGATFPVSALIRHYRKLGASEYNRQSSGRLRIARQRTAFLCIISFLFCVSAANGQQSAIPKEALQVRIAPIKKQFQYGESVQLTVTISNVGSQPFLVPNRVSIMGNTRSWLSVDLRNLTGKPPDVGGIAFDCLEYKPTKILPEDVLTDYLLLQPGTSYVQHVGLDVGFGRLPAGNYSLRTSYSASFSPSGCKTWAQEEIDKFPLQAWWGRTAQQELFFTILPRTKKQ